MCNGGLLHTRFGAKALMYRASMIYFVCTHWRVLVVHDFLHALFIKMAASIVLLILGYRLCEGNMRDI